MNIINDLKLPERGAWLVSTHVYTFKNKPTGIPGMIWLGVFFKETSFI